MKTAQLFEGSFATKQFLQQSRRADLGDITIELLVISGRKKLFQFFLNSRSDARIRAAVTRATTTFGGKAQLSPLHQFSHGHERIFDDDESSTTANRAAFFLVPEDFVFPRPFLLGREFVGDNKIHADPFGFARRLFTRNLIVGIARLVLVHPVMDGVVGNFLFPSDLVHSAVTNLQNSLDATNSECFTMFRFHLFLIIVLACTPHNVYLLSITSM